MKFCKTISLLLCGFLILGSAQNVFAQGGERQEVHEQDKSKMPPELVFLLMMNHKAPEKAFSAVLGTTDYCSGVDPHLIQNNEQYCKNLEVETVGKSIGCPKDCSDICEFISDLCYNEPMPCTDIPFPYNTEKNIALCQQNCTAHFSPATCPLYCECAKQTCGCPAKDM